MPEKLQNGLIHSLVHILNAADISIRVPFHLVHCRVADNISQIDLEIFICRPGFGIMIGGDKLAILADIFFPAGIVHKKADHLK